jgi:hypothetical protein
MMCVYLAVQANNFQLRALVVVGRDVKFCGGLGTETSAQCGTSVDGIIVWDHEGSRITCDITQPNLAIATNRTPVQTV